MTLLAALVSADVLKTLPSSTRDFSSEKVSFFWLIYFLPSKIRETSVMLTRIIGFKVMSFVIHFVCFPVMWHNMSTHSEVFKSTTKTRFRSCRLFVNTKEK